MYSVWWENSFFAEDCSGPGAWRAGSGGELMTRGHLSRQLGDAAESGLGRRLPAHSFRHGFAVHAVQSEVPEKMLQMALEHGTLSTKDRYLKGLD